jgi:hypothetical protein
VDSIFNSFLNTYLQIFYSCFPKIKAYERNSTNHWITKGILNSCKRKKDLYLLTRSNNHVNLRNYYLRYSKIFSKVIKAAKKLCYNNKITQAHQYIYSLVMFVVNNMELFTENSGMYEIVTRSRSNLHRPLSNLTVF